MAKKSKQPLLYLKLDFIKAYDKVDQDFMFLVMERLGIDAYFIKLTKLLFQGAAATVYINGRHTQEFSIRRGVRQGCPLGPYLFIIVAEVLNTMTKAAVDEGFLKGIHLPESNLQ